MSSLHQIESQLGSFINNSTGGNFEMFPKVSFPFTALVWERPLLLYLCIWNDKKINSENFL